MNKIPFGSGTCCPPRVEGITYLKIGPRQRTVGMMGLEEAFQQLYALGGEPDAVTDAELLGMARKSNYIPDRATIEVEYAVALREAYARYYIRQEQKNE
jgi:hypothetical protein